MLLRSDIFGAYDEAGRTADRYKPESETREDFLTYKNLPLVPFPLAAAAGTWNVIVINKYIKNIYIISPSRVYRYAQFRLLKTYPDLTATGNTNRSDTYVLSR